MVFKKDLIKIQNTHKFAKTLKSYTFYNRPHVSQVPNVFRLISTLGTLAIFLTVPQCSLLVLFQI